MGIVKGPAIQVAAASRMPPSWAADRGSGGPGPGPGPALRVGHEPSLEVQTCDSSPQQSDSESANGPATLACCTVFDSDSESSGCGYGAGPPIRIPQSLVTGPLTLCDSNPQIHSSPPPAGRVTAGPECESESASESESAPRLPPQRPQ